MVEAHRQLIQVPALAVYHKRALLQVDVAEAQLTELVLAKPEPDEQRERHLVTERWLSGGAWQRYASEAFAPNKDGVMAVVLKGLAVGAPYRIRAVFRSDGYHLDAHSSWAYLKIVG